MLLFLFSLLFQPEGIYGVHSDEDFRFCAHRMQTESGHVYYHVQKGHIGIVNDVNLNISAPFPPEKQDSVSGLARWPLPEPPGSYRFCVFWFRESSHFLLSYGSKNYSLSIKANYSLCLPNSTKPSRQRGACELHNVSYALAKGSYNVSLPEASGYQFDFEDPAECHSSDLENEVRAVEKQLKELEVSLWRNNRGRKRVQTAFGHLQRLESKLEEVKFQGHHRTFGEGGLLHASVWKFQSQKPQTFGLQMKEDQEVQGFQVTLPETVLAKSSRRHENNMTRAVLLAVSSHQLFKDLSPDQILGGKVVGISLGKTLVRDLPRDQRIGLTFWHNSLPVNITPQCVFFDMGSKDHPQGTWNTSGCEVKQGRNHTICLCDHLTFFAVLMVSSPGIDHIHHQYLTLITYIGCIVSAKASFLTIFFLLCLRKKQRDHIIYIHMNLLWAIFLLDMSFLIAVPLAPSGGDTACKAGAMFLHFGLLACLTWMGIEGYNLYQLVIEVFISSVKQLLLRFCLLGWGLPIFIVFLILAIDPSHYGPYSIQVHDSPEGYTNATICWITRREINNYLNLGFLSLVLFFNSIMLAAVVREILRAKQRERPWKYAVMLLGLSCVLGIPWGLAFFSFSSGTFQLVAVYLFTIINSLQGFLIFLWYLAKVMQVRRSSSMQCSTSNSLRPQSSNTSI